MWSLGFGHWALGFGLWVGLWAGFGFGLGALGFGLILLWDLGFGPWAIGFGLQAFGFGHYVAERKDIAKGYQDTLTKKHEADLWTDELRSQLPKPTTRDELDEIGSLQRKMMSGNLSPQQMTRWRELKDRRERYDAEVERIRPKGATYTIDLPDPVVNQMLDWDAPLSEQPEGVQKMLRTLAERDAKKYGDGGGLDYYAQDPDSYSGETLYRYLTEQEGGQKQASALLQSQGVPGVRYL